MQPYWNKLAMTKVINKKDKKLEWLADMWVVCGGCTSETKVGLEPDIELWTRREWPSSRQNGHESVGVGWVENSSVCHISCQRQCKWRICGRE